MSLNKLIFPSAENKFLNPRFNSAVINNGIDMKNSNINNVGDINGIPVGSLTSKSSSIIIYRQGNGPHIVLTNVYGTWAEVKTVINSTEGAIIIYIDDTKGVPLIDSNTDFQCRCRLIGCPSIIKPNLKIQNNVIVSNLSYIEGLNLIGTFTTIVPLQYYQGFVLTLNGGASLKFDGLSNKPFIELIGSQSFFLVTLLACNLDNSLSPFVPLINMTSTNSLIIVATNGSAYTNDIITGVVGSGIVYLLDSSINVPTNTGMLGSQSIIYYDNASGVNYTDSAPLIGSSNVQGVLSLLKLASTINYTDSAPLIGSNKVQGALDLVKLASTINYTDSAPLIGSANVQGALSLLKLASTINYTDSAPLIGASNVQAVLSLLKLSSTINYTDSAPLIGSANVQGALSLLKLAATINYTDSAPLIGSANVQGALSLLKLASTINYTDSVPIIGASNVQSAVDLLKLSANIYYDDSSAYPPIGAVTVQGAIDSFKQGLPQAAFIEGRLSAPPFVIPNNANTDVSGWYQYGATSGITLNSFTSYVVDAIPGSNGGYLITYNVVFAASVVGKRVSWIGINGNVLKLAAQSAGNLTADPVNLSGSIQTFLSAGDVVTLVVYQNSGGNLNLTEAYIGLSQIYKQ